MRRTADLLMGVVVPPEVHGDLLRPVAVLPDVDDLPDYLNVHRVRGLLRGLGAGTQALNAIGLVAVVPGVVRLPADPIMASTSCFNGQAHRRLDSPEV